MTTVCNTRVSRQGRPFKITTSPDRLRAALREHSPAPDDPSRCGACGFRYSTFGVDCPIAAAAYQALDEQVHDELPPAPDRRTPCEREVWRWDLDKGVYPDWVRAQSECASCPVLEQCRGLLARWYPRAGERDQGPQGVIWAGVAYGNQGMPLSDAQLRAFHQRRECQAVDAA